ncbi:DnaJ family domain-containing protein [Pseudalkalibacillus sp. A8]|uniref:DnaJ family domain-containing protein n=1 Tax=Pseudalkalibacillus sp. A8 TaxID=3382641 RepID=UPI0038B4CDFA
MDFSAGIAEEKIKAALQKGEFDNLPGKGKPLPKDDLTGVPDELRISYKILKNGGFVPPEVQLKKEMVTLEELIAVSRDNKERAELNKRLNEKIIRFNNLMEKRKISQSSAFHSHQNKIYRKLY